MGTIAESRTKWQGNKHLQSAHACIQSSEEPLLRPGIIAPVAGEIGVPLACTFPVVETLNSIPGVGLDEGPVPIGFPEIFAGATVMPRDIFEDALVSPP